MKKLFLGLIACLFTGFMFTSCDKNSVTENSLVGKWLLYHYTYYYNGQKAGEGTFPADEAIYYELFKDGTGKITDSLYPDEADYFSWKVDGESLIITPKDAYYADEKMVYTILELTNKTLSLEYIERDYNDNYRYIYDYKKVD